METYALKKKISKKLFDRFSELIEEKKEYNLSWDFNNNGDIVNEKGLVICKIIKKDAIDGAIIKHAPQMLQTIKECVDNFNKGNPVQQSIYKRLCKIQDNILGA